MRMIWRIYFEILCNMGTRQQVAVHMSGFGVSAEVIILEERELGGLKGG